MSTAPPPAETARLTAQLAAVADELEAHVPEDPLPRFIAPDDDGPPKEVPLGGAMPYDVVVGPFNPVAPPVVLDFEPPKALGRAVFDVTYEGAPGCVHGAVLAATFDIILTAANAIVGSVGPTVRLALRYLRPTLTDEEAVFEGWVTEVTERRIFSRGRIVQDGIVTVEAEGEFAIFNQDRGEPDGVVEPARPSTAGDRRSAPRRQRSRRGSSGRIVARQSLQPSRDPADYAFVHRVRTRFAETDAMGIIHHAAYLPVPGGGACRVSPGDRASLRCGAGRRRADGDAGAGSSPCSRHPCSTAARCASTRRSTCRWRSVRSRGATFQIAYLLSVGGDGAGDRGDGPRVRRRAGPAGPPAGLGAARVRGESERAEGRGAQSDETSRAKDSAIACWPPPGSSARATTMPACMMAPRRRCASGSTAVSSIRPSCAASSSTALMVPKRVALVELVPGVPPEDRGTVEHHDALDLGVDALVQEGVEARARGSASGRSRHHRPLPRGPAR